jgi:hypothetical protein
LRDAVAPARLGLKAVAKTRVRMYEATVRNCQLELTPQLAHVNIDLAVSRPQIAPPDAAVQLLARDDSAHLPCHRHQQLELAHRQYERLSAGEHEPVAQPDLELAGVQDLGGVRALWNGHDNAYPRRPFSLPGCKLVMRA